MTSISNADSSTGKKSKLLWFGFGLVLTTLLLASSVLYINVRNRETDLEAELEKQETISAAARVQNITLWLSDLEVQPLLLIWIQECDEGFPHFVVKKLILSIVFCEKATSISSLQALLNIR